MFCGQCGKRVLDDMLFCPFCGSPIVIPDQDGPKPPAPPAPAPQAEAEPKRTDEPAAASAPRAEESSAESRPEPAKRMDAPTREPLLPSDAAEGEPAQDALAADFQEDIPFEPLHFDAPEPPEESSADATTTWVSERRPSLFDDDEWSDADLDDASSNAAREDAPHEAAPAPADVPAGDANATRRTPERRPPQNAARRYMPVRDVDPDDMFMDDAHPIDQEFDPYDDEDDDDYEDDFDFEEPEEGGFLQRHIRGLVGLTLLAMLVVIFLIWTATGSGQRVLATMNLAWNAGVYNDLGYEAYQDGQYERAADYFERAFARDGENYEYAHSAMVSYYEAGQTEAALAMLKKCIEMNPDSPEPYHELLYLYPDSASRPWEAQELLRLGYERTGDERLRPSGE